MLTCSPSPLASRYFVSARSRFRASIAFSSAVLSSALDVRIALSSSSRCTCQGGGQGGRPWTSGWCSPPAACASAKEGGEGTSLGVRMALSSSSRCTCQGGGQGGVRGCEDAALLQ
eukprot:353284-Chlamydomonas_euryale.AAC.1